MSTEIEFRLVQSLQTSGARAVAIGSIQGERLLAVPQLAQDIPGGAAGINLGDSDAPLLVYKADETGAFQRLQNLPVPGGEDAEFFSIGDRSFLATASIRSGKGPYKMEGMVSTIFEWDGQQFVQFQQIPTVAAKQWRYFKIGRRHFLALAQGVDLQELDIPAAESTIFQWDGSAFVPFQTVPSRWGYNFLHFALDGQDFLAYADHVEPSIILKWDGASFVHFQTLDGHHGRAFAFFQPGNDAAYLAFARISSNSLLYKWNGQRFEMQQELQGDGGREFALLQSNGTTYIALVRFVSGGRHNPQPVLNSIVYRLEDDKLRQVAIFPTLGGTDVTVFSAGNQTFLAVAESINENLRFRTDTRIYQLRINQPATGTKPPVASFQSPEFMDLFTTYTASKTSIAAQLTSTVTQTTSSSPLLVATSYDMLLFPGNGHEPSYINFRFGSRGFKELAAISHLGPAAASLVQMSQSGAAPEVWQSHARKLLQKTQAVGKVNSEQLWRDQISVQAFQGRESEIAAMVENVCQGTEAYLKHILANPHDLTPEFLRDNLLEATKHELGVSAPLNEAMIATFFLVGLDLSYRMHNWLSNKGIDWKTAMVLITGRQGRETSGVTVSTNSIAQVILQLSNLELPIDRLYLAPHGPVPSVDQSTGPDELALYEPRFRLLWNNLDATRQLGETMFASYPSYKAETSMRPAIDASTVTVSELPKISHPDDWFSMNTRMRVVLEDARQLLSGCVTDYAAEQLRLAGYDPGKVTIPGIDGNGGAKKPTSNTQVNDIKGKTGIRPLDQASFHLQTDMPAPIQTLPVKDGVIAYREAGPDNGTEPIIWVHGLPLDSRSWAPQYSKFSGRYRNVFVDLRGYGSSSKLPPGATDITQLYCNDLLALMDYLAIPRARIVGFASAGHIALRFAAQNASRVSALILFNGSPRFKRNGTDYQFGFTDEIIRHHFLAAAEKGIEALTAAILDPAVVFQDLNEEDAAKVLAWFQMMSYEAGVTTLRGFFDHIVNDDDRHLVPLIKAPTLLLSASLGKEVPFQAAMYLKQHLKNAHLVEIPGADHFFNVTRPVVVNEVIAAFMEELNTRSSL